VRTRHRFHCALNRATTPNYRHPATASRVCGGTARLVSMQSAGARRHFSGQTGGRVFLFLHTDNFERDYQNLLDHKIEIVRPPQREEYGTVAVFKDLYGNLWDMIEPAEPNNEL